MQQAPATLSSPPPFTADCHRRPFRPPALTRPHPPNAEVRCTVRVHTERPQSGNPAYLEAHLPREAARLALARLPAGVAAEGIADSRSLGRALESLPSSSADSCST